MRAYLQVLSTGTADCPSSVILHFDAQRYMINCGEGTQRLCMESKFRFSKIKTIFFTRTHWDCIGGAPGMLLTLSDVGTGHIKLVGGENLTHALISTRQFVYRNTMAVDTLEMSENENTYSDENLRVTAVQVYPDNFVRDSPYEWPYHRSVGGRFSLDNSTAPASSATDSTPVAIGSKRSSDELQPSSSPTVKDQVKDPQEIRKQILAGMLNLSGTVGDSSTANKKIKRNKNTNGGNCTAQTATAAVTDVDAIEAARSRSNNGRFMELPRTSPNTSAISYIFQTPDYVGKFDQEAAIKLGLKPGRLYGNLVKGISVSLESGEIIHPHQVISGARPGRVFMVIDCPTVEYISSLVKSKEFERFQGLGSGSESEAGKDRLKAECIVHLGSHSVLSHPDYKAWMQLFGPDTQHIVANQDYCSQKLIWQSQSRTCHKLSKLDPTIFPIPYHDNTPAHDLATDLKGIVVKAQVAESLLGYQLEPSVGWERSEIINPMEPFHGHDASSEKTPPYMKEYYELADKANEEIAKDIKTYSEEIPGKDVILTALGTGSSHPSKYRNVSATLLDMPNGGTFFLDCGEGTFGQMFRQFGGYKRSAEQRNYVEDRIKRLKGIFISHLHADHHLGVVTVIDSWNKLRDADAEPLYLVAPLKFNGFLQELSDVQDFGYKNVQFINCEDMVYWRDKYDYRRQNIQAILDRLLESSGFDEISTVDVIHCPWSYGISMTHKEGWKVVYSGDTRPCENLVQAGHGATVVLHEATFEDDMSELALAKKHSTTQEAIMVGEGMEAKYTMLTHFSQRYPKIPKFDSEDKTTQIGICFDMMSVKLGQIGRLAKYLPALQTLA
ncbi:hypothetical protein BGZ54_003219 [Gamsiella multidivaricata]|nr:hypothetical protein BGZ54_003219 [Gamsiella multidivaricata]